MLTVSLFLTACSIPSHTAREGIAYNMAQPAHMQKEIISAPPFEITTYQRISNPSTHTANVYIEGDGLAWITRRRLSSNSTPTNPVALKLATLMSFILHALANIRA